MIGKTIPAMPTRPSFDNRLEAGRVLASVLSERYAGIEGNPHITCLLCQRLSACSSTCVKDEIVLTIAA